LLAKDMAKGKDSIKMVAVTMEVMKKISHVASVLIDGLIMKNMKETGRTGYFMEKELKTYLMVQFSSEIGSMVFLKDLVFAHILMAVVMMATGKTDNLMDSEQKSYRMGLDIQEIGLKERLEEMEQKNSQMGQFLKVHGKTPNSNMENVRMLMDKLMKVNGKMVNPKAKALKHGLMVDNTKVNGIKENLLVMALKLTQMECGEKDTGQPMSLPFMMQSYKINRNKKKMKAQNKKLRFLKKKSK
jgi:hypothetical protein